MNTIDKFTKLPTHALRWIKTIISPKAGVAAVGALVLAGGMSAHQVAQAGGERVAGTLFGAGVGALAGQRFGGREGAIVGGAIGAVVGNQLAHSSHRGSIIIGAPIWSGDRGHHYRDDRRYYDDRRGRRGARERRQRRTERAERRAYRDGYRQGRRESRQRQRHHRRWQTRH